MFLLILMTLLIKLFSLLEEVSSSEKVFMCLFECTCTLHVLCFID